MSLEHLCPQADESDSENALYSLGSYGTYDYYTAKVSAHKSGISANYFEAAFLEENT